MQLVHLSTSPRKYLGSDRVPPPAHPAPPPSPRRRNGSWNPVTLRQLDIFGSLRSGARTQERLTRLPLPGGARTLVPCHGLLKGGRCACLDRTVRDSGIFSSVKAALRQETGPWNQCGVGWKDAGSGSHLNGTAPSPARASAVRSN